MKVLRLTKVQWNKLEFILNRLHSGSNFYKVVSQELDNDDNILTVTLDDNRTSREEGTGKFIINADKVKAIWQRLTQAQKNKVKARFSNVNLATWVSNNQVDKDSVIFAGQDV